MCHKLGNKKFKELYSDDGRKGYHEEKLRRTISRATVVLENVKTHTIKPFIYMHHLTQTCSYDPSWHLTEDPRLPEFLRVYPRGTLAKWKRLRRVFNIHLSARGSRAGFIRASAFSGRA